MLSRGRHGKYHECNNTLIPVAAYSADSYIYSRPLLTTKQALSPGPIPRQRMRYDHARWKVGGGSFEDVSFVYM